MQKKSNLKWILLLVLPVPMIILSTIVYAVVIAVLGEAARDGAIGRILSLLVFLIAGISIVMILLFPLWLVMLIKTNSHNKGLGVQTPTTPVPAQPEPMNIPPAPVQQTQPPNVYQQPPQAPVPPSVPAQEPPQNSQPPPSNNPPQ